MFKQIRKSSLSFVLISSLAFFAGCSDIENTGANTVGNNLVSSEVIDDINASVMLSVVQSIDPTATKAFGYKAVKINYNTVDEEDNAVLASGLLVVPIATLEDYQNGYSVSMICNNHGTIFLDSEAPSNVEVTNGMPDYAQAVLMTGYAGFAAVLPDYIGYGTSNDENHPYLLKKSSARASLDMIRASVRYMTDTDVVFNSQLYISGYSQGGHTAMALAQEIEENHNDEFTLKALAPLAGPHDLESFGDIEIDASHVMMYPAFLAYLADAYSIAYDDIDLTNVVVEEDTAMYHSLFDGSKMNVEIHGALDLTINYGFGAYTADALFKTSFIDEYKNSIDTGLAVRTRYVENSTFDWTPQTKVNLVHCVEDDIVPFSMSQTAYDTFIENGSTDVVLTSIPTSLIPPATADNPFIHGRCANTAYQQAIGWFVAIRQGQI